MCTTLQLDDDVLEAARVLARRQRVSVGVVISSLARQALRQPADGDVRPPKRSGLSLLPRSSSGGVVDPRLVNQLRDEEV